MTAGDADSAAGWRLGAVEESGTTVRSRWVAARSLSVPLVLLLVLRLPSLFEPHWYTDEAGYTNVAWQMAHGKVLFLTTWNNKPPLLFWILQVGVGIGGASEFGIHLLSTATEVCALVATWILARGYLSPRRVWFAMLVTAFFLATPIFNGDLALPENFLIGMTPWAMVAVLAALRASGRTRSVILATVAGALFAAAILIQQTALADLGAGILIMLVVSRGRWWLPAATAVSAAVLIGVVMAPFVIAAGLHNVIFFLVTSYSGYTSQSLHPSFSALASRGAAGLLLLVGAWTARKWPAERLLPWVWLAVLLLAYGLPNRDYLHFLLPAVPAAALLLARLQTPRWRAWRSRPGMVGAPLLGAVAIGTVIWGGLVGAGLNSGSLFTVRLTGEYYPAFVGKLTGALTTDEYVSLYDQRAIAEHDAVAWIKQNHLAGSTAVVWSADSWAYLLGDLRPILPEPTIYENSALLGNSELLRRVEADRPVVVILTSDAYTAYGPILPVLQKGYTEVEASFDGQLWIRSDVAARVLTAAQANTDLHRGRA
ncbi:MAG TPA: glycosyltransferase family 39 protein [Candidatus Dormibacteraeota bacterium]|nr:glycosyltransferase family 39 protein [Candidatus Dormibacteraeota bacterium]